MAINHVILHIGSDKAGSTAIQECLYANRAWYGSNGVHVPSTGLFRMGGHAGLFTNIEDSEIADRLQSEARSLDSSSDQVVLSWEGIHFFRRKTQCLIRDILDYAYPGATVEIVYYVRNQVDLIQSGILQQIKQLTLQPRLVERLNRPFDEIPPSAKALLFNDNRMFSQRLDEWHRSFPTADFNVRLYDRDIFPNRDIIDDFNRILGVDGDNSFRRAERHANSSLTAEAALVLQSLARMAWTAEDRRRMVDTLISFSSIGGQPDYLFEETRQAVEAYFHNDNQELIRRHPRCSGLQNPSSSAASQLHETDLAECWKFVAEQTSFPTLLAGKLKGPEIANLNLEGGWNRPTEKGVWATGPNSLIQFRPRGAHFGGFSPGIEITLDGKYPGRRTNTDRVVVNGVAMGARNLPYETLYIPTESLGRTYNITIELEHEPRRAAHRRDDQRTFLLRSLSYSVL